MTPDELEREVVELRRLVDELLGAPLIGSNFTSRDGTVDRAIAGRLDSASAHYGLRVPSDGGTYDALYVDERGMDAPQFAQAAVLNPGSPSIVITLPSAATLLARWYLPTLSHAALRLRAPYAIFNPPDNVSAKFNLSWFRAHPSTDPYIASTVSGTLPQTSQGIARLDWLHAIPLGVEGEAGDADKFYVIDLIVQNLSGTGDFHAFAPWLQMCNPDHGATSPGAWTLTTF